jgi:hypothetical protein
VGEADAGAHSPSATNKWIAGAPTGAPTVYARIGAVWAADHGLVHSG